MEEKEVWILGEFYPKVVNDVEVKRVPVFEWVQISVPNHKVDYLSNVNNSLISIFGNFIYPEREILISRLLLEEHNNNIVLYFPWLTKFAHPNVAQFIDLASTKTDGRQKQKNR